jgi:hypothetical protein
MFVAYHVVIETPGYTFPYVVIPSASSCFTAGLVDVRPRIAVAFLVIWNVLATHCWNIFTI